jgi:SAM-dependent methyltransferase
MKTLAYMTLGRITEVIDRTYQKFRSPSDKVVPTIDSARYDRTGLTGGTARKLEVLYRSDDILYVRYDQPWHSFWRAQEFSLFRRHRELLQRPLADFGCGDGSFASALLDAVDYGIDHDPDALAVARDYNLYRDLVHSHERSIPMSDATVQSIMSNSVLEHVSDLPAILGELYRILSPGGRLAFTVPVLKYKSDLAKYFGQRAGEQINRESYHRNLLTEAQWRQELKRAGFGVNLVIHYQPDWFTFWYRFHRFSGPRAFGRLVRNLDDKLWRRYRERYVDAVRESISRTVDGANIFVVARKSA